MSNITKGLTEAFGRYDRRDAYQRDYDSSVAGMGKRQSQAYQADGGANDEGWDEPQRDYAPKPVAKKGFYFYKVPADQDTKAQEVGLFRTKSGKWYSPFQNTRADMFFGPGKYWEPKTNESQLSELSNTTLASYKKKAGADATAADNAGDFKKGHKRFKGIVKATNKEFANDAKGVAEEQLDELSCWSGYHRVAGTKAGFPGSCAKNKTNEEGVAEEQHSCPHCGGEMVSEELMNEKKDACYYKVKSRYKVWPSAYASGALVKCRKSGADNWGDGGKKNESSILEGIERADENLHKWFKEKWVRFGPDGKIRGDCARGDDSEGKPKCLPQSKAQNLGKEGRASAAARKRREDPNPERSGKAINVNTKKN